MLFKIPKNPVGDSEVLSACWAFCPGIHTALPDSGIQNLGLTEAKLEEERDHLFWKQRKIKF